MADTPPGTVTLLFTDIEGSTRRWEALPAAMARALAAHDDLLRWAIEAHGGAVFKTVGDAFCAAFADPGDALQACLAGQHSLATTDWGEVGQVRVRMALHTGEPERRENDYFGPPVNRVARLLATGYGGQVLVSAATAERLGDRLPDGTTLVDLGAHRLKDLLQPERIFQLAAPGLEAAFPPLKSLDRQPHNLPAQPTPLVGREREVAEARALLEGDTRLVTLTGPGGTGKTRLGLQVAAELVDALRDGAWFVGLAPIADAGLVVPAIAGALGVRETGYEPLEATLLEELAAKDLLLLLDNFEHVTAAAPAIGRLLAGCPKVRLLVTSRAALRVYGERELAVPPLRLPDLRRLPPPDDLAKVEAVALFVERAAAVRPGFALTDEHARPVAELVVKLEGLPLAIELAAARARVLPPAQLLARLTSRLALLTGGAADRDPRQRTLRGAIAWSHDLLTPEERALFRRLAVFAGGTFEAIEAVCAVDGAGDALDGLESLAAKSLLRQEDGADGPRIFMLETIREFAAEQLDASGEAGATRARQAAWFLGFAEQAEPHLTGREQAAWLERLEAEHDNLRTALAWLAEQGDPEEALRLPAALWRFWDMRGHLSEGLGWLKRALARTEGAPPALRAKAVDGAGVLAWTLGDAKGAVALHERALALSRAAEDRRGIARAMANLGWIAARAGELDRAVPLFEEALAIFRQIGDDRSAAVALHALHEAALDRGNYGQAEALGNESLALWGKLGEQQGIAALLQSLGILSFLQEDCARAETLYQESLAIWRDLGDRLGIASALTNLGRAVQWQGDVERAVLMFDEAVTITRESGDKGGTAFALYCLGHASFARGEVHRAWAFFAESLANYREIDEQIGVNECLEGLAGVACMLGKELEGVLLLGAAEALREATGIPLLSSLRADHERTVAAARAALGEATVAEAWAMGRIMSPEQAVAELGVLPAC